MKKLLLLVALLVGCASQQPVEPQKPAPVKIKKKYHEVPATLQAILYGYDNIKGPITKKELEGATVSFSEDFTITIGGKVSSSHDQLGAIVRQAQSIHVSKKKGGKIHLVEYDGENLKRIWVDVTGSNSGVTVPFLVSGEDGNSFSVLIEKDKNGVFIKNFSGYEFTEIDWSKSYIDKPDIKLDKIYFRFDFRSEEGGVVLPQ